jgi:hypothetical protein
LVPVSSALNWIIVIDMNLVSLCHQYYGRYLYHQHELMCMYHWNKLLCLYHCYEVRCVYHQNKMSASIIKVNLGASVNNLRACVINISVYHQYTYS